MTMHQAIPPRRARLEENTAAELAIRAAVEAVEAAGCHTLLTEAVELLVAARHKVADYVDQPLPPTEYVEASSCKSCCDPSRCASLVRGLAIDLLNDAEAVRVVANRRPLEDQFAYGRANALDHASSRCFELLDQIEGRKPMPAEASSCDGCCSPCCGPISPEVRFTIAGDAEPTKDPAETVYLDTMEGEAYSLAAAIAALGENRPTEFIITRTNRKGESEETLDLRCCYAD